MATDAELNQYASAFVLKYLDTYFTSTAVTDYIDGSEAFLITSKAPIISITSITDTADDDTVLTATNYDFYPNEGMIYLDDGIDTFVNDVSDVRWGKGRRRYKVIYQAGYTSIPDDITLAIALMITYLRNRSDLSIGEQKLGDFNTVYRESLLGMPVEVKNILDLYKVRHF